MSDLLETDVKTAKNNVKMTENNVESVETDVWTDKNNVKPADNDVKTAVKCRALSAMDTLRSFKRCGAKGVYRPVRQDDSE